MKKYYIGFFLLLLFATLKAQDRKTADYILDGGKLIVDIFRVAKKDKNENKEENKTTKILGKIGEENQIDEDTEEIAESSFCFNNKTETRLKVELKRKNKSGGYYTQTYDLTISPGESECALTLISGIYHYKVLMHEKDEKYITIKQGDVQLDESTKKIKSLD